MPETSNKWIEEICEEAYPNLKKNCIKIREYV